LVLSAAGIPAAADSPQYLLELDSGRRVALAEVASKVAGNAIVVVGEQHTEESHHRAQLRVIQALEAAGARVAIGLEMFRHDSQADLDRWTAGETAPADFQKIYSDNWNYPWEVYRPIFEHARNRRIPMIGLNVPRDITRQVARSGFASLSEEQRGRLSDVTCSIDAEYMRYIRSVYGAHAHGNMSFEYFCEAQMVWDTAMAVHALGFLSAHPDAVVVILTGVGHAQKGAVPRQIRLRSQVPVTAMLPEVPGSIDAGTVDRQDADYLLLDLD
jgi:uncharacterized iron-regulated protein